MLTRMLIRDFKRFNEVDIELGNPVVFIGPNNSGKTTALQALALWDIGLKRWTEKYRDKTVPEKRPGVTINRRDLYALPVTHARLLWRNLAVQFSQRVDGDTQTQKIFIEILVEGVTRGRKWESGLDWTLDNRLSAWQ